VGRLTARKGFIVTIPPPQDDNGYGSDVADVIEAPAEEAAQSRVARTRRRRNRRPSAPDQTEEQAPDFGGVDEIAPQGAAPDPEELEVGLPTPSETLGRFQPETDRPASDALAEEQASNVPTPSMGTATAMSPARLPTRAAPAGRDQQFRSRQSTGPAAPPLRVQPSSARPASLQQHAHQRHQRAQAMPSGVPSAAALDDGEIARPAPAPRQEPSGDLALLLRGFEEIQQRNTDRLLSAMRQAGLNGDVAPAPRALNVTERVGVFVDVPNLIYAARYLNRWIDFGKLLDRLLAGRRLVRAHAFSPTDPDPSAEQQFLTPVKSQGFRLTTKNYRTFASGAKKADMDLDLCMEVVRLVVAKALDCVVLCSGDGDFMPLVEFCSDNGVRVEAASFVEATSDELRQACDRFYNLSAMDGIRLSRPLGGVG